MTTRADKLRRQILDLTAEYYAEAFPEEEFVPQKSRIPVAGRVFDATELKYLVDASLDFWLTTGRYAEQFEKGFADFFGVKHAILVNSGSSANLLALACLTSQELGKRRLCPGDEVITVAAAFPTTVNPILQNQLVPVFVDVTSPTYNVDVSQLEAALSERTKAIILAHTLGNPFDLEAVTAFAKKHNLWLIEDCCDAVGATYNGKPVGTFGDLATVSFYPAHHITMGEGGCVLTSDALLKRLVVSFRDWGRDCWCKPGDDNTCGKRFDRQFGDLPLGYDHKYVYSHIGYNLKATDMQAAVGCAQLEKLTSFIKARKQNWKLLRDGLAPLGDKLILPEATPNSDPSWFGFLITVADDAGFCRRDIVDYLEQNNIQSRMLFAGNLTRHPCFDETRKGGRGYRVVGELAATDRIMHNTFWIGVYPGLNRDRLDYIITSLTAFVKSKG